MDCEKFDRVVLDLLYGELDELGAAAARRHIEHCSRCKGIYAGLRATREVGTLPLLEPPPGLEVAILEAERRANARLPLQKKVGRVISILAVYAMRPQLAMAALFLIMVGSSLFFLRARPGERDSVFVTERGVPESEAEQVAVVKKASAFADAAPSPKPAPQKVADEAPRKEREPEPRALTPELAAPSAPVALGDDAKVEQVAIAETPEADSLEAAMAAYQGGRYVEAERRFEAIAARGGSGAPAAALHAVEALRRQRGCPAAAPRYEEVHTRYSGTPSAREAAWQAGDCYRALGEIARSRQSFEALLSEPEYRSRAAAALAELNDRELTVAARKAKAASAVATAAASAARPAAPAAGEASPSP